MLYPENQSGKKTTNALDQKKIPRLPNGEGEYKKSEKIYYIFNFFQLYQNLTLFLEVIIHHQL